MTKYFKYMIRILISNIKLILFRITFNRIQYSPLVMIGRGTDLSTNSNGNIKLGKQVTIEANVAISGNGGKIVFEGNNYVNRNSMIQCHDEIIIGRGTTIGPNVLIYDHDHNVNSVVNQDFISSPIRIGKNVWIGANVVILKGVSIGDGSVVAAGSVVSKSIPDNVVYYQKREVIEKHIDRT